MNYSRYLKQLFKFLRINYIISILLAIVLFTLLMAGFRILTSEEEYVYAKVKVSQGYWWANTQKPNIWYARSIRKGVVEQSISGKANAEIISVQYYPFWGSDQYDVYMIVRLSVSHNEKTNKYTYKRSILGISSPVDFEFPTTVVSGTVMDISDEPFKEEYSEKIITFEKKYAAPWEYDAIEIGDTYSNGEDTVVEILDKGRTNSFAAYGGAGNNYQVESAPVQNIVVTARIKVQEKNGEYIFGEEQILRVGKIVNILTNNFVFDQYTLSSIDSVDNK